MQDGHDRGGRLEGPLLLGDNVPLMLCFGMLSFGGNSVLVRLVFLFTNLGMVYGLDALFIYSFMGCFV